MKPKQFLTIAAATSFIIIALSLAYYLVIFLPKKYAQDQATNLYNQTSKQLDDSNRAKAVKSCTEEFGSKSEDPEFAKTILRGAQNVGDIVATMDSYIKICMLKKGYTDY